MMLGFSFSFKRFLASHDGCSGLSSLVAPALPRTGALAPTAARTPAVLVGHPPSIGAGAGPVERGLKVGAFASGGAPDRAPSRTGPLPLPLRWRGSWGGGAPFLTWFAFLPYFFSQILWTRNVCQLRVICGDTCQKQWNGRTLCVPAARAGSSGARRLRRRGRTRPSRRA